MSEPTTEELAKVMDMFASAGQRARLPEPNVATIIAARLRELEAENKSLADREAAEAARKVSKQ